MYGQNNKVDATFGASRDDDAQFTSELVIGKGISYRNIHLFRYYDRSRSPSLGSDLIKSLRGA